MAFRQQLAEGDNPEDAIVVLLGPWKIVDEEAVPAAALPGKKHTAVHTIAVRVRASGERRLSADRCSAK